MYAVQGAFAIRNLWRTRQGKKSGSMVMRWIEALLGVELSIKRRSVEVTGMEETSERVRAYAYSGGRADKLLVYS